MNNNLQINDDSSTFIKKFIKKLFPKDNNSQNINAEEIDNNISYVETSYENSRNDFEESIKVVVTDDVTNNIKREEFLNEIENNPELLYSLSNDKLKILEKYYLELISKEEEKLANLKKSN